MALIRNLAIRGGLDKANNRWDALQVAGTARSPRSPIVILGEAVVAERVRGVQLPFERLQSADRGRRAERAAIRRSASGLRGR